MGSNRGISAKNADGGSAFFVGLLAYGAVQNAVRASLVPVLVRIGREA